MSPSHPHRSRRAPKAGATPRPAEIRATREAAGLSRAEAAALIYCSSRGWEKWEIGERAMHPAFFELFRIKIDGRPENP